MGKIYTRFQTKQNGAKTLPFGAAHTHMAYTRDSSPSPPNSNKTSLAELLYTN